MEPFFFPSWVYCSYAWPQTKGSEAQQTGKCIMQSQYVYISIYTQLDVHAISPVIVSVT